jgi:hypothetical protein
MTRKWLYINKTTGTVIESDDLQFLLTQLTEINGYTLPIKLMADLIIRGKSNCVIYTKEGIANDIELTEQQNTTLQH